MRPLLRDGDLVAVRPVPQGGVRPGDVVLCDLAGKRLMHRVWWRRGRKLWMKDDTGSVGLHAIPKRGVLGLLAGREPFSRGWLGLAYGLACTAVFFVGRFVAGRAPGVRSCR